MADTAQLTDDYHLSLSIGKALWDDLVGAALPLKVRELRTALMSLLTGVERRDLGTY